MHRPFTPVLQPRPNPQPSTPSPAIQTCCSHPPTPNPIPRTCYNPILIVWSNPVSFRVQVMMISHFLTLFKKPGDADAGDIMRIGAKKAEHLFKRVMKAEKADDDLKIHFYLIKYNILHIYYINIII